MAKEVGAWEDCRYTPEKGTDDDQRDVDPVHG